MNAITSAPRLRSDAATACAKAKLAIEVLATPDGPPLTTVQANIADLTTACTEAWRDCCLRRGFPDLPFADAATEVSPSSNRNCPTSCDGYSISVRTPGGRLWTRAFSLLSLTTAADRAAKELVAMGLLGDGASYHYGLVVKDLEPVPAEDAPAVPQPRMKVRHASPSIVPMSLPALFHSAEQVGDVADGVFPVFFSKDAFDRAESAARRGVTVETGGVLCGLLGFCESTGELFPVVTDVIEVNCAEETEFTLAYTGSNWLNIHQELGRLRGRRGGSRILVLGNCHGHNFLPHQDRSCEQCEKQATCNLTSVFVSKEDLVWHMAVFARQPWALCHIFGLDARGQPANGLFTLHNGRLRARGYYIIPKMNL